MKVITKQEQPKRKWSGGITTQLYIFPEMSAYNRRNFDFRISTATIDTPSSVFTPLPGVSRVLMPLKGKLTLNHEGHHTKALKPYESDTFSGDWKTTCSGKGIDFNLMTTGNKKGVLIPLELEEDDVIFSTDFSPFSYFALYVVESGVSIKCGGRRVKLSAGDIAIATNKDKQLTIEALDDCQLVISIIE
jgi:environmental stress-induced protein Ves